MNTRMSMLAAFAVVCVGMTPSAVASTADELLSPTTAVEDETLLTSSCGGVTLPDITDCYEQLDPQCDPSPVTEPVCFAILCPYHLGLWFLGSPQYDPAACDVPSNIGPCEAIYTFDERSSVQLGVTLGTASYTSSSGAVCRYTGVNIYSGSERTFVGVLQV